MYKKFLFLTSFVLVLSLVSISYAADARMIKLDLNNTANNDDANTHTGFTKFAIPNSGSEVNGVVIDLGGTIDSRRRPDPNGRAFDDIYRDFIFGVSPSGVTITLWGLGANRDCNITMWAYDNQSVPTRRANWTATWGDANDVNYIFTTDFNGGALNWPPGDGSTDYVATAKTDYLGRIMLTSTRGPNSPAGQPFAFVNALMVEPKGTFVETNYAHRPQPVDGAEAVPVTTVLKWRKGGLSEKRDVYLGTVFANVNDANRSNPLGVLASQNQDANTYDPSGSFELEVGKTYYWRVDEVNGTTPPQSPIWKGTVWSFNTFTIGQPIGWWKLDEGSGSIAYDSSGNDYDATIYGDPVWRTGSPHGGSGYLDFDGDGDYTDANYISGNNIQLPDLYTVTLWFKSEGGTGNRDMFSAVGINEGHGILLELRGDDSPPGRIRYIHRSPVSGSGGPANESIYTPAPGYADNQWHHIAVQRASGGRYVYIDGVQVAQDTDTRPGFDLPLRVLFGTLRPGLLQRFWNGGIDDVRIYNRVLSQTEIREVMRSPIASGPNPSNGATDVELTPTLSWMPGIYAANVNGHKVYLDPDQQKVVERTGCQVNGVVTTDPCYGPIGPLKVNQTYYWAVDEVNVAYAPYLWEGDVWSFKTVSYFVVDDFDSYGSSEELKAVWEDYWVNGTCAEVFVNTTTVRSGQSMEYQYKNYTYSPYYSEANATVASLGIDPNWLGKGAKALTLWFYGNAGNDANEEMYIKLVDSDTTVHIAKVGYKDYGDMNDVREASWHEWSIPLTAFTVANPNFNLRKVARIVIGFGDGTRAASDGIVYFEDIRLYGSTCVLSERDPDFALIDFAPVGYSASGDCKVDNEELTIMVDDWLAEDDVVVTQNPGEANLVAYYPLNEGDGNNAEDVVGDHNGTLAGDVSWITPGFIGSSAIHVNHTAGSRIGIGTWNPVGNWDPDTNTGDLTLAVWAKWAGTTGEEQGMIGKRDDYWNLSTAMFGFGITAWPAYTTNMLALRGNTDVTSGNVTMQQYLGRWTHFAATFPHPSGDPCDANDFARLYINGREVASGAFTFGPNTVASMAIGNTNGVNGGQNTQTFNGDLDEVRIYNRALTAAEAAYLADMTPGDDELHVPVPSAAEIYAKEPVGQQLVNFKDFALVAKRWLEEDMYP